MTRPSLLRRATAVLVPLALVAGCAGGEDVQRQPESAADGVQATGLLDGQRVAISRGEPEVVYGDCDPNDGADTDLCMVVRSIDGIQINIVVENPQALVAGETIQVSEETCDTCDDVRTVVVIDLRIDGEQRRAEAGKLEVTRADQRFAAEFDLNLPNGDRLTGAFDVRPGIPES